jgi:hypothetical protein
MDTPPPPTDDLRRDPPRPWGSAEPATAPNPASDLEPEDTSLGIKWDENRALFLRFCPRPEFDPYAMPVESVDALFRLLKGMAR